MEANHASEKEYSQSYSVAYRKALQRGCWAVASRQRSAGIATRDARKYQWCDSILGVRQALRRLLRHLGGEHTQESPGPYTGESSKVNRRFRINGSTVRAYPLRQTRGGRAALGEIADRQQSVGQIRLAAGHQGQGVDG